MTDSLHPHWLRWPRDGRIAYGADYNPEQWPREVWAEDVRAMRAAGVNLVSVGIFSWAHLQPAPDEWRFDWLDEVMDLLAEHGVWVDLATATASPPPWLAALHPEILPVAEDGTTVWPGSRQHWRPTSPVFREYALRLARELAERYRDHRALAAWHVSNELGCHNVHDYSDDAARAFRDWLRERHHSVDGLNDAWSTSFWSQRYTDWEQVLPPRATGTFKNPGQVLDFRRFCSDALLEYLQAERDLLHSITPDVPVTTNFMVLDRQNGMDYARWAPEVDFVSNDHYVFPGPRARDELSFSANLTGNLADGRPWLLMEHSTSAVNWQPVNLPKGPGELVRDSLTHLAHGADGICFFQWRQSAGGAEKYHSAMVPHAGTDSVVFRRVTELGRQLGVLGEVAGSTRLPGQVGIVFDWDSWWTIEQETSPSQLLDYRGEVLGWYSACLEAGLRADVIPTGADLGQYPILITPLLHLMPAQLADRLTAYVEAGGHLLTTYFSGTVDECDRVWLGGYPGALRDLLGVRVEEFCPLAAGESVPLRGESSQTPSVTPSVTPSMTLWSELVAVDEDVEVLLRYADGLLAGRPAVTRRPVGAGSAGYVSGQVDAATAATVVAAVADAAGVVSELPPSLRGSVELAVRRASDRDYWFLISRHGEEALATSGDAPGEPVLLTGGDSTVGDEPRLVRVHRVTHVA